MLALGTANVGANNLLAKRTNVYLGLKQLFQILCFLIALKWKVEIDRQSIFSGYLTKEK